MAGQTLTCPPPSSSGRWRNGGCGCRKRPTGEEALRGLRPALPAPHSSAGGGRARPPLTWGARVLVPCRRFSSNAALTTEEQEQRAIYAAILEYEQDHVRAGQGAREGQRSTAGGGALLEQGGARGGASAPGPRGGSSLGLQDQRAGSPTTQPQNGRGGTSGSQQALSLTTPWWLLLPPGATEWPGAASGVMISAFLPAGVAPGVEGPAKEDPQ